MTDRAVLVTGASGGIGGAVAAAFAAQGYRVAVHGNRGAERARSVAARIGGGARAFVADLSDSHGCEALAREVSAWAGGPVAGLVHAAGPKRDGLVTRLSEADWDQVVNVHLSAPWRLVRHGLVAGGGFITFIGSGATAGRAGQAAYGAAKSGLVGLTHALARELGAEGVRVNTVVPGPVETPMWQQLPKDERARVVAANGLSKLNDAGTVADFTVALSNLPATSGQVLTVGSRLPW